MKRASETMGVKGVGEEPKSGHRPPAPAAGVGNERKADMKGALNGNPTDGNPLRGAMKELHSQHPHKHDDHGPHHGTKHHHRHESLGGMRPGKGR